MSALPLLILGAALKDFDSIADMWPRVPYFVLCRVGSGARLSQHEADIAVAILIASAAD
jgi:hypothetical protein